MTMISFGRKSIESPLGWYGDKKVIILRARLYYRGQSCPSLISVCTLVFKVDFFSKTTLTDLGFILFLSTANKINRFLSYKNVHQIWISVPLTILLLFKTCKDKPGYPINWNRHHKWFLPRSIQQAIKHFCPVLDPHSVYCSVFLVFRPLSANPSVWYPFDYWETWRNFESFFCQWSLVAHPVGVWLANRSKLPWLVFALTSWVMGRCYFCTTETEGTPSFGHSLASDSSVVKVPGCWLDGWRFMLQHC